MTRSEVVGVEAKELAAIFRVTDTRTGVITEAMADPPQKEGWNPLIKGWSVGTRLSASQLEIDEDLDGLDLGIFPASNHVILWGRVAPGSKLPTIARYSEDRWSDDPPRIDDGKLYFRFDRYPLRIGRHEIQVQLIFPPTGDARPGGSVTTAGENQQAGPVASSRKWWKLWA